MVIGAEELIAPGGPSAPVWAFFTAISLALVTVLAQQLKARSDLRAARREASKANESAIKAQENTESVSNGFVGRVDRGLNEIRETQNALFEIVTDLDKAHREHLQWHLERDKQNADWNSSHSRP